MNVTYEHKPAMTFIGFSTSIRPEEGYQKCPEFWDREYSQKQRSAQEERMLELLSRDESYVSSENIAEVLRWYREEQL